MASQSVGHKMLLSLNTLFRRGERHIYAGTVEPHVIAKRRAANKVARKQRKVNRHNGSGH